jgi:hypothetical protein
MGYTEGKNKYLYQVIDDVANNLISSVDATDGYNHWTNADTTWNTTVRTANDAKRALKYQNGSEIIYVALEVRNSWYSCYSGYAAKGLRITFSSQWDSIVNSYVGAIQQTSIPFLAYSGAQPVPPPDLATTYIEYYLWVESNGFAIMARSYPNTLANGDNSFFAVVERCPNKFYNDNQPNFYCYNVMNIWPTFCGYSWYAESDLHRSLLRPFIYKWPNATVSDRTPNSYSMIFGSYDRSHGFKSAISGKVYFARPIIFNNVLEVGQSATGINPTPIFQSDIWFYWSENMGLNDGDIISMEGQTTKYQVKYLDTLPDSASKITYAIKFVA